ncbi:MAG: cytochrome c biogenesis protein ResB, partial [bacterium]
VLISAFFINLSVCSVRNILLVIRSRRNIYLPTSFNDISSNYHEKFLMIGKRDEVIESIKAYLKRNFYRSRYISNDYLYFERGKFSRFGPIITHVSILIILIGGIIVSATGFKEYRKILVGETIDVPNAEFQLRVDDFKVEFYPDLQTPKDFISKLTVIEDGIQTQTKDIEVNHPMKYKGIKFYQSAYGLINTINIELSKNRPQKEIIGNFEIEEGKTLELPDLDMKIKVIAYVPDFVIDSKGNISSRSIQPINPAALIELYKGDELLLRSWYFKNFPDFHGLKDFDYSLKFVSLGNTRYYTELQISSDPGLPIIWVGSLLMMLGLFLSFYMQHKQLWIYVSENNLEVKGKSYKNRANFENEFGKIRKLSGNIQT